MVEIKKPIHTHTHTHKRCFCEQHVRVVFVFFAKENTKRFTGCDIDWVNQRILSPNGHFLFFTKIRIFFKENYKTNSPTRSRRRKGPYYRTALSTLQIFLWRSPFLFLVNNENPLRQIFLWVELRKPTWQIFEIFLLEGEKFFCCCQNGLFSWLFWFFQRWEKKEAETQQGSTSWSTCKYCLQDLFLRWCLLVFCFFLTLCLT